MASHSIHNLTIFDVSVLELAAEEIKRWPTLAEEVKKDLIMAEEKTVYSQVSAF
jgi:hypothetical protein